MTEQPQVRAIRLSAFHARNENGTVDESVDLRLETPMKAGEVWKLLVGGLIATYKTEVHKHLDFEGFVDETMDEMRKMMSSTSMELPTIN
jgi:hypothetical protein